MLKLRTYERIFIKFTLDFNIANIMMYIICQFYVQFNCIVTINVFCKGNRNPRAPNIRSYSTNQKYTPCRRHKPLRFSSSYNYFTTLDGLQKKTQGHMSYSFAETQLRCRKCQSLTKEHHTAWSGLSNWMNCMSVLETNIAYRRAHV